MKNYLRKKWINFLAKNLFKTITEDDFLKIDDKKNVYFKGNLLTGSQKADLARNAVDLLDNQAWQLLLIEVSYAANKMIYFESKSTEDLIGGKMALWVLDLLFQKAQKLARLQKVQKGDIIPGK